MEKEILQDEESSALSVLVEIDNKIDALQSFHLSLTLAVHEKKMKIVQFTSTQKKVRDLLLKIVQDVLVANSMKAELVLKRKKSTEEEAEILAKFAPLEGFSFSSAFFLQKGRLMTLKLRI